MEPQSKTKRVYFFTIIVFIFIVVLGTMLNLWRGSDYKFLLILFILITMALRLDEIYNELVVSKTKSSDMYLIDARLQTIIESLETLNQNVKKLGSFQPENHTETIAENQNDQTLY